MTELNNQNPEERLGLEVEEKSLVRLRRAEAETTVKIYSAVAAAIGLLPLPLADAPLIIIAQFLMIRKLCGRFGRPMGWALALVLLSALAGPELFQALLKLIPGLGSLAGALVAGGCTWLAGRTVLTVLEQGQPFSFREYSLKDR